MQTFLQTVVVAVGSGSLDALLALGIVLIYRTTGVLNFAQAAIGTFGAYVLYAVAQGRPIPFRGLRIASSLAAAAAFLLAVTLFATSRPARAPQLNLVVQEVGPEQRAFRSLVPKYDDVDAATAMVDTVLRND